MSKLCPLFSGSNGNSMCITSAGNSILVDVGKSTKQMEIALKNNNIDINSIQAIFITHEHSDHVQGLKVFTKRYGIKVYASFGTIQALKEKNIITENTPHSIVSEDGISINGIFVKPFRTSHDCAEGFGYIIQTPDKRKVAIATDLGFVSKSTRNLISDCDVVVLESNHDIRMLQSGSYPYYLKRRILSNAGHLSNEACSNELPYLIQNGVSRLVLAHLSQENNIPELAYETAVSKLSACGFVKGQDYDIWVAPRENTECKTVFF